MAAEIWVKVVVANPMSRHRSFVVKAIVDNGSTDSAMPSKLLRQIGIKPLGWEKYKIWGPRTIRRRWAEAVLKIGSKFGTCRVTFEPSSEVPIIGAVSLETLGYSIDMDKGRLTLFRRRLRPGKRRTLAPLPSKSEER